MITATSDDSTRAVAQLVTTYQSGNKCPTRQYYGRNQEVIPNDHCEWCEKGWWTLVEGWYETEQHYVDRLFTREGSLFGS